MHHPGGWVIGDGHLAIQATLVSEAIPPVKERTAWESQACLPICQYAHGASAANRWPRGVRGLLMFA